MRAGDTFAVLSLGFGGDLQGKWPLCWTGPDWVERTSGGWCSGSNKAEGRNSGEYSGREFRLDI